MRVTNFGVKCLLAFALFCLTVECAKPEEDYYKTLGVPKDASHADIKRAFRQLSIKYHPDKGGDPATYEKISHGNILIHIISKSTYFIHILIILNSIRSAERQ